MRVCVYIYIYIRIYILYYIYSVFDMPSIHVCSKWFLLQSCLDINVLICIVHCIGSSLLENVSTFQTNNYRNYRITHDKATAAGSRWFQSPDRGASCALRTGRFSPASSTVWNHRNVQRDQHHQPCHVFVSIRPHFYLDEVNARNRWKQL